MNMVTLSLASRDQVTERALAAFAGQPQGAHISFASAELLWKTLTRRRWDLLQRMTGQGAMSAEDAARRAGREVKSVQSDLRALVAAGLLDQSGETVSFPYDAVHVDLLLTKAA